MRSQNAGLAVCHPLREHPAQRGGGRAEVSRDKALVASADAPSALPALNPNQPTHSRQAPIKLSTTLCGLHGFVRIADALAQIQRADQCRNAGRDVHHRAAREVERGNLPPRNAFRKPPLPHTMCAIGKYTNSDHSIMNSSIALNFMRSAKAPEISAGVMIANINW